MGVSCRLAEALSPHVLFLFGCGALLVALVVLYSGRRYLRTVDEPETIDEHHQVIVDELETAAV